MCRQCGRLYDEHAEYCNFCGIGLDDNNTDNVFDAKQLSRQDARSRLKARRLQHFMISSAAVLFAIVLFQWIGVVSYWRSYQSFLILTAIASATSSVGLAHHKPWAKRLSQFTLVAIVSLVIFAVLEFWYG